ncbi:hypothetical protein [Paenibacillus sp. MMS18-CY102]|uniref:hypothetical protein n=1 Tax=Paenibacillus sp. MMS18-CY102 TaxID=2682849 RepID=UPI001365E18D|nr:hypothetical protein [Paenibacillus sp. MMS18-CY102]MWC28809.1 hypothetical protein [Paenibacillus sp. MMS18-CY102]
MTVSAYDFSLVKTYLHISPEGVDHLLDEMAGTEFFNSARLVEMMEKTGEAVQANGRKLPGSFFGTSLSHLCITKLIFLAMYDKVIDLSLDNVMLQIDYEEGHGHPHLGYRIKEVRVQDMPAGNGDGFVLADWRKFLSASVTPAVEAIAEAANAKAEMIWQQFGGITGMVRDFVQNMQLPPEVAERFTHHFNLLSEEVAPDVFNRRRNPFKWELRYIDNPYEPGEQWVMRSACCYYDSRKDGEKCFVCPRMTLAERAEKVACIQAGADAQSEATSA